MSEFEGGMVSDRDERRSHGHGIDLGRYGTGTMAGISCSFSPDPVSVAAHRRATLDRRNAAKSARKAAANLNPPGRPLAGNRVWTPEDVERLKVLRKAGGTPGVMVAEFPGKTTDQIIGKIAQLQQASGGFGPSVKSLGLEVGGGGRPSPEMVAERDARVDAEIEDDLRWRDANLVLLGDPSPHRQAVTRRMGLVVDLGAPPVIDYLDTPLPSISAVRKPGPGSRPGDSNFLLRRSYRGHHVNVA